MTSEEARNKIERILRAFWTPETVSKTLSAFASAVRAEAFEEMRVEAERRFESLAGEPGFGPSAQAIAYGRMADWAAQQAEKARTK